MASAVWKSDSNPTCAEKTSGLTPQKPTASRLGPLIETTGQRLLPLVSKLLGLCKVLFRLGCLALLFVGNATLEMSLRALVV
jgi:hypothetical protein